MEKNRKLLEESSSMHSDDSPWQVINLQKQNHQKLMKYKNF